MATVYRNKATAKLVAGITAVGTSIVVDDDTSFGSLGNGETMTVVIQYAINEANRGWVNDTSDVPSEIRALLNQYETVEITAITGNVLTAVRTNGQAWLIDPQDNLNVNGYLYPVVRNVITADDASILGGVMNRSLLPNSNMIDIGGLDDKIREVVATTLNAELLKLAGTSNAVASISNTAGTDTVITLPVESGELALKGGEIDPVTAIPDSEAKVNYSIYGSDFPLLKLMQNQAGSKTLIACVNISTVNSLFSVPVVVGENEGSKAFKNSGGFNANVAANLVITEYGNIHLVSFDHIDKSNTQWQTYFASISLVAVSNGLSAVLAKDIYGQQIGANALYNRGFRLPVEVVSTVAPTATDDVNSGFLVGDKWRNTTTNKLYVITDTTEDTAVWKTNGVTELWSDSVSSGTHSINDGEAFSDYDLISFTTGGGNKSIEEIVTTAYWDSTSSTNQLHLVNDFGGDFNVRSIEISRASDTSFTIHTADHIYTFNKIRGIKL